MQNQYLAAIDARLILGKNGGDSTYWTALLHGFRIVAADLPLLFISNAPRPQTIPWSDAWRWENVAAPSSRVWSWISFPLAARRLGAKVIHTQYSLSPLAGRRGVTTIHDVSFFVGPEWFPPRHRLLLRRFVPASARRSAAVITVSETSRKEIEHWIPAAKGKTHVTLLAAAPWIQPVEPSEAKAQIAKKFGVDGPFALTVGSAWARKNQTLAIQAMKHLEGMKQLEGKSSAKLLLVGNPNDEPIGPNVLRTGYVDANLMGALYSAAGCFVFPSLHEGFGLPVLEAYSCSCPVICGQAGALPEVAGGAAELLPDFEPATWADAVDRTLNGSGNLDLMRERGRARASEFSWTKTAQATLDVYRQVAQ